MIIKNYEKIINNGKTPELKKIRIDILNILNNVINAVDPYNAVKSKIYKEKIQLNDKDIFYLKDFENIYLVGFGKASIGMAQAVSDTIEIKEGAIITNQKNKIVENKKIKTYEGGHPLPNQGSVKGTEKILEIVKKCSEKDLLIVLISGGGSALLTKPRINLKDLQKITNLLLKCGANINEINTIRKHLSYVKGGQLASNTKSKVVSLIISDIINDPIGFIASGPTYPDLTTFKDAKKILNKYNLWVKIPLSAKKVIENGLYNVIEDTPDKNSNFFRNVKNFIIANNEIACQAAINKAKNLGYKTMLLTTSLDGEAKDVGKFIVKKALNFIDSQEKYLFISGGETTVTIRGNGKGGRNQEMVLGSVKDLNEKNLVFSSFATDGIDGTTDAAGAIADSFTYDRALNKNLNPDSFLNDNNSNAFFKELDDLYITGPTGTNVMDVQILIKF